MTSLSLHSGLLVVYLFSQNKNTDDINLKENVQTIILFQVKHFPLKNIRAFSGEKSLMGKLNLINI